MQLQTGIVKDGIDFLTLDKVEIKEFGKKNHSLKGRCKQKNINNKNCQFMYDSLFRTPTIKYVNFPSCVMIYLVSIPGFFYWYR